MAATLNKNTSKKPASKEDIAAAPALQICLCQNARAPALIATQATTRQYSAIRLGQAASA